MANKEKIDYLLLDIRELETLVAAMRDAEIYPVSFFSQAFNLTHKILNEVHSLETIQVDQLRKQMEEHQALIQSMPRSISTPIPEPTGPALSSWQPPLTVKPVAPPVQEVIFEAAEPEVVIEETVVEELVIEKPVIEEPLIEEPIIETPVIAAPPVLEEPKSKPVAITQTEATHKVITVEKTGVFLSDILEKKNLSDFRKAFSLNDRFRFRRELFGGDESRMNNTLSDLNAIQTFEDSISYLNNVLNWNVEDEAVADFIKLLEKRFL